MFVAKMFLFFIVSLLIVAVDCGIVSSCLYEMRYNDNPNPQAYLGFAVFMVIGPFILDKVYQKIFGTPLDKAMTGIIEWIVGPFWGEVVTGCFIMVVWPLLLFLASCRITTLVRERREQKVQAAE